MGYNPSLVVPDGTERPEPAQHFGGPRRPFVFPPVPLRAGWTAQAAAQVVTPLIARDALDLACLINREPDPIDAGYVVLMAVDHAARHQAIAAQRALLLDVHEALILASEVADKYASADADGDDGTEVVGNEAMRLKCALDSNEWVTGLLSRVSAAIEARK